MLFKVINNNDKFVEYISICVPDTTNIYPYLNAHNLQRQYPILFANLKYIGTNYRFNFTTEEIVITCSSNMCQIFTLKEVVSAARANKIQRAKNIMSDDGYNHGYANNNSIYDGYFGGTIGNAFTYTGSTTNINTNTISISYTYTPTVPLNYIYITTNTANTTRIG